MGRVNILGSCSFPKEFHIHALELTITLQTNPTAVTSQFLLLENRSLGGRNGLRDTEQATGRLAADLGIHWLCSNDGQAAAWYLPQGLKDDGWQGRSAFLSSGSCRVPYCSGAG